MSKSSKSTLAVLKADFYGTLKTELNYDLPMKHFKPRNETTYLLLFKENLGNIYKIELRINNVLARYKKFDVQYVKVNFMSNINPQ